MNRIEKLARWIFEKRKNVSRETNEHNMKKRRKIKSLEIIDVQGFFLDHDLRIENSFCKNMFHVKQTNIR